MFGSEAVNSATFKRHFVLISTYFLEERYTVVCGKSIDIKNKIKTNGLEKLGLYTADGF